MKLFPGLAAENEALSVAKQDSMFEPPPHHAQHWNIQKPDASGVGGVVASQSLSASQTGIAILNAGGNAIDAAVAMAFALAVVEPWNSGLGGIGFGLVHLSTEPNANVVDFGPRAPRCLGPDSFVLTDEPGGDFFGWPEVEGQRNLHGPLSFAIPSAVAGYATMHRAWGRLPVGDVLSPAIALARRGLAIDWFAALKLAQSASFLRHYQASTDLFFYDGLPLAPPHQGEIEYLKLPTLQRTLEQLAHAGLQDFYKGDIARSIVDDTKRSGGVLNEEDLVSCEPEIRPSLDIEWRGNIWQTAGGLTGAPTAKYVFDALRQETVTYRDHPDADWYARFAAVMQEAFKHRFSDLGDTSSEGRATCTSHLSVCDKDGNTVSLTTTLLSSMGSCQILPGTGVLMNNGIMWFDPRPGRPNSVAPGKRPLTNMCPIILAKDGKPFLAAGASGGRRVLASVLQLASFVADFGMTPEQAALQPRIDVSDIDHVTIDRRLAKEVRDRLGKTFDLIESEYCPVPLNFACPNLVFNDGTSRHGAVDIMTPAAAALAQ